MKNYRLQVSVSVSSCPSLCLCDKQHFWKNISRFFLNPHGREFSLTTFFLCLSKIAPCSGTSSDIAPRSCMLPSRENRRIYYFCIVSQYILRTRAIYGATSMREDVQTLIPEQDVMCFVAFSEFAKKINKIPQTCARCCISHCSLSYFSPVARVCYLRMSHFGWCCVQSVLC